MRLASMAAVLLGCCAAAAADDSVTPPDATVLYGNPTLRNIETRLARTRRERPNALPAALDLSSGTAFPPIDYTSSELEDVVGLDVVYEFNDFIEIGIPWSGDWRGADWWLSETIAELRLARPGAWAWVERDVQSWLQGATTEPGGRTSYAALMALEASWPGIHPEMSLGVLLPPTHEAAVVRLAFDGAGQFLRSTDAQGRTLAWDTEEETPAPWRWSVEEPSRGHVALREIPREVRAAIQWECVSWPATLTVSRDDRIVAAGGPDGTIRLYEIGTASHIRLLWSGQGGVTSLVFRSDGRRLASGGSDGTVRVWRLDECLQGVDFDRMWESLAAGDAGAAERAAWSLAAEPAGVQFVETGLHQVPERIAQLIADLDHERTEARESATTTLAALGEIALPALTRARRGRLPPEAEARLDSLLKNESGWSPLTQLTLSIQRGEGRARHTMVLLSEEGRPLDNTLMRTQTPPSGELVRLFRAVRALERAGTPQAMGALRWVVSEFSTSPLAGDAAAALRRLGDPPAWTQAH